MKELKMEDNLVLSIIKRRLVEGQRENVKQIILFGSLAREDVEMDSDYDLFLLVDKRSRLLEEQADDIAYEILDIFETVVTIFVEEMDIFHRETIEPLFCDIRKEGLACENNLLGT